MIKNDKKNSVYGFELIPLIEKFYLPKITWIFINL
jgi:hypothetical protein